MTKIICLHCKKECEKPTKEINRQIKQGRTKFYCSLSCSSTDLKTTTEVIKSNCLFCGKEIETTTHKRHKRCCSKLCSVKYSQSFIDKDKLSKTIKRLWNEGKYGERYLLKLYDFVCVTCGKPFQRVTDKWTSINHPFKTCSKECCNKRIGNKNRENPNCGGETNYKKYRYKGIWMDSTWEKDLAEWMDLNKVIWERNRKLHQFLWTDKDGKKRRYYPDFYLPYYKTYVDTKNPYLMKCDDEKIKSVIKENNINLICGNLNDVKKKLADIILY